MPAAISTSRLLVALAIGFIANERAALAANPRGFKKLQITATPSDIERNPHLNDYGDIVWSTQINHDPDNLHDIFLYSDGQSIRLTDDRVGDGQPDINNLGVIVWCHYSGPNDLWTPTAEIARWSNGTIEYLTDDAVNDNGPSINDSGEIVWCRYAYSGCYKANMSIERFDGSDVTDLSDGSLSDQAAVVNNDGFVVWTRYDFCNDPWTSAIMMADPDGNVTQLSDGFEPQAPSISPTGVVAWADGDALYTWNAGTLTKITDDGNNPYINARGDIAFIRWNDTSKKWETWFYEGGEFRPIAQGSNWEIAYDMNEHGDIVVQSSDMYLTRSEIYLYQRLPDGDMNCDGQLDFDDIDGFVDAVSDRETYESRFWKCDWWLADCNGDRHVDFNDIDSFVACLINNGCP